MNVFQELKRKTEQEVNFSAQYKMIFFQYPCQYNQAGIEWKAIALGVC